MGPGRAESDRWRTAAAAHVAAEEAVARLRRTRRAAARADRTLHVPPRTAPPRDPNGGADRFGQLRFDGRRRAALPMRIALALWAHGFGADAITAIAAGAGVRTSSSAVGRLLAQARRPFNGSQPVRADDLAAELRVPAPAPDAPAGLATRMRRWRARHALTKTRAARLAGVTHAMWRRLERGETTRKAAAVEAIERAITQGRPTR